MTDMQFERDPENGMLIGPDGCHYDTKREIYHFAVLGLCGCGRPEDAYNFCRAMLKCCDQRKDFSYAEDGITQLVKDNPEIAAHVMLHLLDTRDVIEHGSGIGGSWLTERGEAIVDGGDTEL